MMGRIVDGPHVVAADHAGNAPDPAVDDIVIEWLVTRPEEPTEQVVYCFMAETHHGVLRLSRN